MAQAEMADALGIPVERYRKYERRSAMPVWFLERFCAIVGADIEFVVTGRRKRRRRIPLDLGDDERG